eukprot:c12386_g1_i1 orf=268-1023(+)
MGSFLKRYGSKWRKKPKAKCETPKTEHLSNPWTSGGGPVKVQVYAAPVESSSHDFVHLQCEVEFDPQKDYAQVLAEARTHLKLSGPTKPSHLNTIPWLNATSSQYHLDAYRELHSKLGKPTKPKLWRYFFFWQKPSTNHADFESIFSSPPHPTIKQLRKNDKKEAKGHNFGARPTRKATSGPLNIEPPRATRKNNSGPLYTDGLPSGPFNVRHTKKSYSGPLGPMNNNLDHHLSPYELLHRPPLCSPLYSG